MSATVSASVGAEAGLVLGGVAAPYFPTKHGLVVRTRLLLT